MSWEDFKRKLTSRKLWIAICEFVSMLILAAGKGDNVAAQVTAIIMAGAGVVAYIIGEGLVDASAAKAVQPILIDPSALDSGESDTDE